MAKQTILPEIIGVIGEDAAQKLLAQKGGARIRIPARMKNEHWLANIIGQDLEIRLCEHFTSGVGTLEIALPISDHGVAGRTRRDILLMLGKGASTDAVARTVGVPRRTVQRVRGSLTNQKQWAVGPHR